MENIHQPINYLQNIPTYDISESKDVIDDANSYKLRHTEEEYKLQSLSL